MARIASVSFSTAIWEVGARVEGLDDDNTWRRVILVLGTIARRCDRLGEPGPHGLLHFERLPLELRPRQ